MLGTVQRAGDVLDLFTTADPEWGATTVARELGIAKSQAHEMLVSLSGIGLLRRVSGGQYRLGWRTVTMNSVLTSSSTVRQHAGQVMHELVVGLGETVHLAVWDRGKVVYIGRRQAERAHQALAPVGARLPAHCTGVGKVLLSELPETELDLVVDANPLRRYTETTSTEIECLRDRLAVVRERGLAVDEGEFDAGVRCIAMPIRDASGGITAALSICIPVARWKARRDACVRAVATATDSLTKRLRAGELVTA